MSFWLPGAKSCTNIATVKPVALISIDTPASTATLDLTLDGTNDKMAR